MSQQTPTLAAPAATVPPVASTGRDKAVLVVFTSAIFTSAFLLFLVQPMFSRMVLPLLGGTPAVWNTCMLFFQAALLGGYLYAHLGASKLGIRRQAALHVVLLAVAALLLPLSLAGDAPRGGQEPIAWLLGVMVTTIGLPFLVLSATGPMLQKWFAGTGHPGAQNPYWLYAASNLGSMLALLGYPFLMEPRLRLAQQSMTWAMGYGVLAALVIASAVAVWRLSPRAEAAPSGDASVTASPVAEVDAGVTGRERMIWIGLAFIPSSLLLSVTSFITTDVAPVPLLWVVPLALYLLTFTLAFAVKPPLKHDWMLAAQPFFIAAISLLLMYGYTRKPMQVIPLHLVSMFVTAMVCHGELARRRPSVRHLTEFYLWIALGGVLGGIFNVLVAPLIFTRTWEYHIVLVLACLARPWPQGQATTRQTLLAVARAGAFVFALLLVSRTDVPGISWTVQLIAAFLVLALVSAGLGRTPLWLAACIALSLGIRSFWVLQNEQTIFEHRSFYGRFAVLNAVSTEGLYHTLYHGSTLHGAQNLFPGKSREPLTYYVRSGPLGRMFSARAGGAGHRNVAVIGLGTGTLAAYSNAGENWTFYEIDPAVEQLARNPRYFRYLSESPAKLDVVLGDARLSMAKAPARKYDIIVVDAFNSDAIPVHLLTREALALYFDKLAPGGVVALHLSNRFLQLEPVVAALAKEGGFTGRVGISNPPGYLQSASEWAVVARNENDLGTMAVDSFWRPLKNERNVAPWTDDFSSLLSVWGR